MAAVRAAAEKALKSERKAGKMVRSFHIDLNTVIDPAQLQKESRRIRQDRRGACTGVYQYSAEIPQAVSLPSVEESS